MPNPSTDLLTRFVAVAPKEWNAQLVRLNPEPCGYMVCLYWPQPLSIAEPSIVLSCDVSSAGALILLLDKLEEAQPDYVLGALSQYDTGYSYGWWNGNTGMYDTVSIGATRIEAVVKAYVEVMEK